MSIKLGLIGCGAIGSYIARKIPDIPNFSLRCICDINREKAEKLANSCKIKPEITKIDKLIKMADLVIEAASVNVVNKILPLVIKEKKGLVVMSVGGLLEKEDLLRKAENEGIKIYVPSGAIAGIDGLKAAALGNIKKVHLKTRKPPYALIDAPYILENNIKIDPKERKTIFKGKAIDAIAAFPGNINVSSTLSLAGIGPYMTIVEIIQDPNIDKNIHEVLIEGDFGRLTIKCENIPLAENPKTSYLASLSAIALLKSIAAGIKIGT